MKKVSLCFLFVLIMSAIIGCGKNDVVAEQKPIPLEPEVPENPETPGLNGIRVMVYSQCDVHPIGI